MVYTLYRPVLPFTQTLINHVPTEINVRTKTYKMYTTHGSGESEEKLRSLLESFEASCQGLYEWRNAAVWDSARHGRPYSKMTMDLNFLRNEKERVTALIKFKHGATRRGRIRNADPWTLLERVKRTVPAEESLKAQSALNPDPALSKALEKYSDGRTTFETSVNEAFGASPDDRGTQFLKEEAFDYALRQSARRAREASDYIERLFYPATYSIGKSGTDRSSLETVTKSLSKELGDRIKSAFGSNTSGPPLQATEAWDQHHKHCADPDDKIDGSTIKTFEATVTQVHEQLQDPHWNLEEELLSCETAGLSSTPETQLNQETQTATDEKLKTTIPGLIKKVQDACRTDLAGQAQSEVLTVMDQISNDLPSLMSLYAAARPGLGKYWNISKDTEGAL